MLCGEIYLGVQFEVSEFPIFFQITMSAVHGVQPGATLPYINNIGASSTAPQRKKKGLI